MKKNKISAFVLFFLVSAFSYGETEYEYLVPKYVVEPKEIKHEENIIENNTGSAFEILSKGTNIENAILLLQKLEPSGKNPITVKITGEIFNSTSKQISEILNTRKREIENVILDLKDTKGLTVIKYKAFYECRTLRSIAIPDTVAYIEPEAFAGCYNLQSIEMSDNIVSIGKKAFAHCGLQSITIPENIRFISDTTFDYCKELSDIYFKDSKSSWERKFPSVKYPNGTVEGGEESPLRSGKILVGWGELIGNKYRKAKLHFAK